jgi:hypothetical protein
MASWSARTATAPGQTVTGLTFPDARHLVSGAEWRHWDGTNELVGPDPTAVQAPLADQLRFVDDGEEIAPGVQVRATPGHTPGHLSLVVTDPAGRTDERVVILGDVMHCQVQVVESEWSFGSTWTRRRASRPASSYSRRSRTVTRSLPVVTSPAPSSAPSCLPPLAAHGRSNDKYTIPRPALPSAGAGADHPARWRELIHRC